jgi:putative transcriptional regulator
MPRMRKPNKDEIRARRTDISARARAGKLSLPSAIPEIRHALGLNQQEFAKLFRLTLRQVKELERGIANPTAETLNRIAKVFGFSLGFVPRSGADLGSASDRQHPEQASTDEDQKTIRP